jgi:prepilin-type N-terminal cleavage/methylation domain-containing protein
MRARRTFRTTRASRVHCAAQQHGFTLIEVVIATAIVSLLAASLMATMSIAFRARRTATRGVDVQRSVRLAMDAISHDLRSALPPSSLGATTALRGPFLGVCNGPVPAGVTSSSLSSSSLGSAVASDNPSQNSLGAGITFSNTASPIRTIDGGGDVQQVSFALLSEGDINRPAPVTAAPSAGPNSNASPVPDSAGPFVTSDRTASSVGSQNVLVRRVRRQLLAPVTQTPEDQILCRGVTAFSARYFDGSQWTATWDSTAVGNALPLAVELTIQITLPASDGTNNQPAGTYTMTRTFSVPCGRSASSSGAATTP